MTRLIHLWDAFRTSFWFIPALMGVAAVLLAFALPEIDSRMGRDVAEESAWLATTVSAGQTTVSTIAGASVTVTGVVFSITMVTLSLTTNQFGPRLIRAFMADRTAQITLGAWVSTSLYCLIILRLIRGLEGGAIVPHISVLASVVLATVDLAILVYFVHHTAEMVQPSHVVREVAGDLDDAIDRLFPERIGTPGAEIEPVDRAAAPALSGQARTVTVPRDGYVQGVDEPALMQIAKDADVTIELLHRPGDFVADGLSLARVRPPGRGDADETDRRIREAFVIGRDRTPRQDLGCAIGELTEIAVRALSPGVNDPFTAVQCIDGLSATFGRLAARDRPDPHRYDDDQNLRIVARPITFGEALGEAYDPIRQYCRGSLMVNETLLIGLGRIAATVDRPGDADELFRQAEMIVRGSDEGLSEPRDRERIRRRLAEVRIALSQFDPPADVSFESRTAPR
ncbi:DUF2254 domain-containing protein [Alienimonas californiensis]|uniref:DUF2254 domain-containing protein n=1 Tax=Alienimonas californiensis TaxID=2527989 RepID=UPI0011A0B3E5|nr:DUF2254 domain-containing protein [Alienimonas californiensis]